MRRRRSSLLPASSSNRVPCLRDLTRAPSRSNNNSN